MVLMSHFARCTPYPFGTFPRFTWKFEVKHTNYILRVHKPASHVHIRL